MRPHLIEVAHEFLAAKQGGIGTDIPPQNLPVTAVITCMWCYDCLMRLQPFY